MSNKTKKYEDKYADSFKKIYSISYIIEMSVIVFLGIFLVDYFNLPSKLFQIKWLVTVFIVVLFLLIMKFVEFKPWNLFILKTINCLDVFLEVCKNSVVLYVIYTIITLEFNKLAFGLSLSGVLCVLELYRILFINNNKQKTVKTNVYDLKALYYAQIKNDGNLILINDRDADYDLLKRDTFINRLADIILNCYTDDKFVIALEGAWGSGKTTILNNLKDNLKKGLKKSNIIIIDDFDPWSYEDEKSLFRGMFDSIIKNAGIKFSYGKINMFFNTYLDALFYNSKYKSVYSLFKNNYFDDNEINRIRYMINDYLKNNNIRLLFIIDNIERAERENIAFVFKLINNILNFQNTIYLLSFDDEKMRKTFNENLNIDYSYLKKIIQLEINVPAKDEYTFNEIISTCINNLLGYYGMQRMEESDINLISKSISDLRELKRYLNSVITFQFIGNQYLNCREVFLLEILKREVPELYKKIPNNKEFFISEDTSLDSDVFMADNRDFNQKGKEFFDKELQNVDVRYRKILARLFPYVNNYVEGKELKQDYHFANNYNESIVNKRIYNARYFDLYFSQTQNEFTLVNSKVEEFVETLNNSDDYERIQQDFGGMIMLYDNSFQKFILELLEMYLSKVKPDKKYLLLKLVYSNYTKYDDSFLFLGLSSLSRAEVIMAELITDLSNEEFNDFKNTLKGSYSNLYLIHQLIYWIDNSKHIKENAETLINDLNNLCNETIQTIFSNNINLLDNDNYLYKNLWGLYHGTKDMEKERKKYVASILNENTIFRFLNDIVGRSIGNGYGYAIQDDNINKFSSRENVGKILSNIKRDLTEDENILKYIFYNNTSMDNEYHLDYDKKFKV